MIRTTRIAFVALAAVVLAACSSADTEADTAADTEAASFDGSHVAIDAWADAAAADGVIILDVRTPGEYAEARIDGAVLLDVNGPNFAAEAALLDPDAEYAVYCRSGNRSRTAIDIMANAGIPNTLGLEGGIGSWAASGRDTVSG